MHRDLPSSGIVRSANFQFVTDISEGIIGPKRSLTNYQSAPRKFAGELSSTLRRKPEIIEALLSGPPRFLKELSAFRNAPRLRPFVLPVTATSKWM